MVGYVWLRVQCSMKHAWNIWLRVGHMWVSVGYVFRFALSCYIYSTELIFCSMTFTFHYQPHSFIHIFYCFFYCWYWKVLNGVFYSIRELLICLLYCRASSVSWRRIKWNILSIGMMFGDLGVNLEKPIANWFNCFTSYFRILSGVTIL